MTTITSDRLQPLSQRVKLDIVCRLTLMSYSEFKTIAQVQEKFGLTIKESENLFVDIQPLAISDYLQQTLKRNLSIANAINTEKARSELLIAPI
ncbi:MAG: hypothetical protein ACOVVP_02475, partial [Pseudanabaena sp.]